MLLQPSGTLAIVWLLEYSNFGQPYLSRPNFDSRVFRLYEKLFESIIQPYSSDWPLVLTSLPKF